MKYSHHQTKYIGKYVGLRNYQHHYTRLNGAQHTRHNRMYEPYPDNHARQHAQTESCVGVSLPTS